MSQQFSRELFDQQLEVGKHYEDIVYSRLKESGIFCVQPTLEIPDNAESSWFTKYQKDIVIPPDFVIEVKSRNLLFGTDPVSFPFDDAALETVHGWQSKETQPRAIVFISQQTKAMLAVSVNDSIHDWTERWQWDGLRKIRQYQYFIPKNHLRSMDEMIEWLKKKYPSEEKIDK